MDFCWLAPILQKAFDAVSVLDDAQRALMYDYTSAAEDYRLAIAGVNHTDVATGVSAEGLAWHQQLRVSVCAGGDADVQRYASAVSPLRVLKLYRAQVIDLLTGEAAENHAAISLNWTIPTPRYNESAYDKIGIAQLADAGAARQLESAMQGGKIRFAAQGDGLIGVVGAKAEIKTVDSEKGLNGVLDELDAWRKNNAQNAGLGNGGAAMRSFSTAQSGAVAYYGQAIASGEWVYQRNVIYPALLAELSDAQVAVYAAMSEAVENGDNRCFAQAIDPDDFDAVEACYRLSNPLSALVAAFDYRIADGVADVEYALPEEENMRAIDEWRAQIERIVNYCLIQGDTEITAARLYQYVASCMQAALPDPESEDDPYAAFYPGAFYALMQNRVAANDASVAYAYLLMQTGVECNPVREAMDAAIIEDADAQPPHQWLIVWTGSAYSHADPELDIANPEDLNAERDTLGHFGMSDEKRCAVLRLERAIEMAVPDALYRQVKSSKADEDAESIFAVTECPDGLAVYGMQQTVTVNDAGGED